MCRGLLLYNNKDYMKKSLIFRHSCHIAETAVCHCQHSLLAIRSLRSAYFLCAGNFSVRSLVRFRHDTEGGNIGPACRCFLASIPHKLQRGSFSSWMQCQLPASRQHTFSQSFDAVPASGNCNRPTVLTSFRHLLSKKISSRKRSCFLCFSCYSLHFTLQTVFLLYKLEKLCYARIARE